MIYQFEHEEIKRCRQCPCHSWADFPDEKDWCDLQDKQLAYDTEPEYNDCPLVAISKTETTSEPCEWCKGDVSQYFDVNWYDFIDGERGNVNCCPFCGRRLEEAPKASPCIRCPEEYLCKYDWEHCPHRKGAKPND